MAASLASPVLADSVGPGGTAALVMLVLIIACVGIFFAFTGSLKRLRGNVAKGTFNTEQDSPKKDAKTAESTPVERAVTQDPKGPNGAGA